MSVKLEGGARFQTTCRRAASRIESKQPDRKAARIAGQAARIAAPRRTGRLARSIKVKGTVIRAEAVYAGPINYGWPRRNIKAQPFMYDAMRKVEPQWLAQFTENIDRALAQVKGI